MAVLLSSCYVSKYVAPPSDSKVTLAKETDQLSFKKKVKLFYLVFGLVPLTEDKIENTIAKYNLTSVRFTHKTAFEDGLVTGILYGLFGMNTVIIEGNIDQNAKTTTQPTVQPKQSPAPKNSTGKSKIDRLKELKELLDAKVITQSEYDTEKKKILAE